MSQGVCAAYAVVPSTTVCPSTATNSCKMDARRALLPLPVGPVTTTLARFGMDNDRWCRAGRRFVVAAKRLCSIDVHGQSKEEEQKWTATSTSSVLGEECSFLIASIAWLLGSTVVLMSTRTCPSCRAMYSCSSDYVFRYK